MVISRTERCLEITSRVPPEQRGARPGIDGRCPAAWSSGIAEWRPDSRRKGRARGLGAGSAPTRASTNKLTLPHLRRRFAYHNCAWSEGSRWEICTGKKAMALISHAKSRRHVIIAAHYCSVPCVHAGRTAPGVTGSNTATSKDRGWHPRDGRTCEGRCITWEA